MEKDGERDGKVKMARMREIEMEKDEERVAR